MTQVALVAHTSATNTSHGTAAVNTTGANFIAVCEAGPYGAVPPTDSVASNKYVLAASAPNVGFWSLYLYVAYNPTTSPNETWSVNGGGYPATVEAFSGVTGPDNNSAVNQTYSLVLPTLTPANANELVLSCFQPQAASVSSPLTIVDSTGGGGGISTAYQIQTVATPVAASWVEPGGSGAVRRRFGGKLLFQFESGCSGARYEPAGGYPPTALQLPISRDRRSVALYVDVSIGNASRWFEPW